MQRSDKIRFPLSEGCPGYCLENVLARTGVAEDRTVGGISAVINLGETERGTKQRAREEMGIETVDA